MSKYLNAAFTGAPYFKIDNKLSNNLDYSKLGSYQMIVLNGLTSISSGLAFELNQYTKNGGNLLVFPGRSANMETYKGFLSAFQANQLVALEEVEKEAKEALAVAEIAEISLQLPNHCLK